jgi:multidrug efflux system membrane fusion protein
MNRENLGRFLGRTSVILAATLVLVTVWRTTENPRTDDATLRANFVGIAAEVGGRVVEIHVRDEQPVEKGDLLLLIDPSSYEIALARAKATLGITRSEVASLEKSAAAAGAAVDRAEAQLHSAEDHLQRIEPLLVRQFVTAEEVDQAQRSRDAAAAAVVEAREQQAHANDAIGNVGDMNARVRAAEEAVNAAELDLSRCRVVAPFRGKVVNLTISEGAYARPGMELFTLVDTRLWWVVANFRETELPHIPEGAAADVFLHSRPSRRYHGTVVGLGWAVVPENGSSAMGLPRVERALDWVRLAARFPVRIQVDDPDDAFRLGASAIVTVHSNLKGGSGKP